MKKRYWLILFLAAAAGFFIWTYRYTYTPYGRLDYIAAVSTRLLSVEYTMRPDPKSDFQFKMPLNFAFLVGPLWPKEKVAESRDISIPGDSVAIPARLYRPKGSAPGKSLPLIVYYHGGGFVLGSIDIFDALARSLANSTDSVVVSVGYRLAPAHPHPAAIDDSYAALVWAAANAKSLGADQAVIGVAGDSAGGNIAAVVARLSHEKNGPRLAGQILYYPATDLTDKDYPSRRFIDGYGLSSEAGRAFNRAYIPESIPANDPNISPLYATNLIGLPPALIVTGGFDPLTDSARAYARRLKDSGVTVVERNYPDIIHGFLSSPLFRHRRLAFNETGEFWRDAVKTAQSAAPAAVAP